MRTMDLVLFIPFIVSIAAFTSDSCLAATFDVMKFGAIGDGIHDDSKAFIKTWEAVCDHGGEVPVLQIPDGRSFLLGPTLFEGPCKSANVQVKVLGNLVAPKNMARWKTCECNSWLCFSTINGLIMHGSGKIDANGETWWNNYDNSTDETTGALGFPKKYAGCNRPTALYFSKCNGLQVKGLTHINSPRNHISIDHCVHVNVSSLHILAPQQSPNTDGIDISSSSHVSISYSNIQTGDDCVAINHGCSDIRITGVSCGPGHGISVGSLGAHGAYATVERVFVEHCNFYGAQNGVRIKTWPGGSGHVRVVNFEHIGLKDVQNPIIIDQFYCNGEFRCEDQPSALEISHVTYRDVRGSSANEKAIQLMCSKNKACHKIKMEKIKITPSAGVETLYATCKNVFGTSSLTSPPVPCLSKIS